MNDTLEQQYGILQQLVRNNEGMFYIKHRNQFMQMVDIQPEVIILQDWDATGYGLPDCLMFELF